MAYSTGAAPGKHAHEKVYEDADLMRNRGKKESHPS